MKWFVYRYNVNARAIEQFNVFSHSSFKKDVINLRRNRTKISFQEFNETLRRYAMYYFWGKCEYEVIIQAWPPSHSDVETKIDIYEQLMLNWNEFAKYVYNYDGRVKRNLYLV